MASATNGASTSIWHATAQVPDFPPLAGDAHADVCVIGAGIAGLTTAYLLATQGRRVIVIDAAGVGAGELLYRWSGEVMEPADGPAYLGLNPMDKRNVYIITGDSGNGMTHCTIGGMLVTDLILGRDNPWAELYDPARKVTHGLSDFVSEQANTLARYGDWVKGGEVESAAQIAPGEGAIINQGLHKLAVYRDPQGALHALSATCTHLGCVVHFNSAEQSWDCPCHGSRFDTSGAVLHGPAPRALAPARLKEG